MFVVNHTMNQGKISKKTFLTDDVIELQISTDQPFNFQAGQYISIKISDKPDSPCFRAYSIASAPIENGHELALCIKVVEGGRASNWLNTLKEGDPISFLGPIGKFLFKNELSNALFIATGTGLAPFRSMIEYQLNNGNTKPFQLMFGVRHIKDVFYKDVFEKLAATHSNFQFDLTLSRPENTDWNGHQGRVTTLLENADLDPKNTEVYICGLKDMIESVTEILKQKGFPESSINFEKYD